MRALGLLPAVVLMQAAAAAEMLSPQDFTERFAQSLGAALPGATVRATQALRLDIRSGGNTAQVNLANVYGEYKGSPGRFDELVGIFAEAVRNPVPPPLERARIVPVLKPRAWLAEIAPLFHTRGQELLSDPFNDELAVVYVEDRGRRARYLGSSENVGDRGGLRALAVDNLRRMLPKIRLEQYDIGLMALSVGGDYEPSLLLFDDLWRSGSIAVDGEIVVAMPTRDMLLVTGSHNGKGLDAMRRIVAKLAAEPHRLTDRLFVYRGGRFVTFVDN